MFKVQAWSICLKSVSAMTIKTLKCVQWIQSGARSRSAAGALGGRSLSTRQIMDFHLNQIQVNSILQAHEQVIPMMHACITTS